MHFIDESFWVAFSFMVFICLAYRPVKKAIINSLDAKIVEIKKRLEETEKLKQEAENLLAQVKSEVTGFEARRAQIMESAETSTSRLIEMRSKEIEFALARMRDSALKTLDNKKTRVAAELRDEFIDLVMNSVRSYLVETGNNAVSDTEIIDKLINKKQT